LHIQTETGKKGYDRFADLVKRKKTLCGKITHTKKKEIMFYWNRKEKKRHLNEDNFMSVSDRCEFPILFQAKPVEKFTTVLKQYKHLTIILS